MQTNCPTCRSDQKDMPHVGHGRTVEDWMQCDICGDVLCPDPWHELKTHRMQLINLLKSFGLNETKNWPMNSSEFKTEDHSVMLGDDGRISSYFYFDDNGKFVNHTCAE